MKTCRTCLRELDDKAFGPDSRAKDGLKSSCNECRTVYEKLPQKGTLAKVIEAPRVRLSGDIEKRLAMAVEARMEYYRINAIEAIFDLAMMEVSPNPLQNQVKMAAASKLAGPLPGDGAAMPNAGGELDPLLKQLAENFHKTAPRIRAIRERVVEYDDQARLVQPE